MTFSESFLHIDPRYQDAIRLGHANGEPLRWGKSRIRWGRWLAAVGIGAFVGLAALGLNADLVTSCAVGVMAGGAVLISDGWRAR